MVEFISEIKDRGYILIDGLLDDVSFGVIKNSITKFGNWDFGHNTSKNKSYLNYIYPNSPTISNIADSPQFVNKIYFNRSFYANDFYRSEVLYDLVLNIIHKFQLKFNYNFYVEPIRIKSNFQYPIIDYKKGMFNTPHVDSPPQEKIDDSFITGIYYLNNSDGSTYLFDQIWEGEKYDKLTTFKEIESKANRLVLFSTKRLHAGSPPTKDIRVLLNLNMQLINNNKHE